MEMLTLYTIAALAFAALTLISGGKWIRIRESRKLKKVLRDGREYEALILDTQPVKPSIFSTENLRLRVQLLGERPVVVEFDHDASYLEYRELMTGKVITVDIDPADHHNVMIVRKSSLKSKPLAKSGKSALLAI